MKYKNTRLEYDGQKFASKREFSRFLILKGYEKAGIITNLRTQVRFELIPAIKEGKRTVQRPCFYVADFVYTRDGKQVVEDTKGYRTQAYDIKKKLMRWRHGIEIIET